MPVPTTVPPTPIPTRTPTVTPSPVPSPTPVVPPNVKSGAVVIGSTPMTAKHFIPLWLNSQPQFLAMPLTLPALTWFDDKAQPIPDLASKIDINADATVITFTLPIKATWSDGTPLTTKDVAFTYKLALDPALNSSLWGINFSSIKGASEFQKNTAKDVDGIKIIDAQTIRFELKESNAAFLFNTYLGILPAHLLGTINPRDIEQQAYIDWPNVTSGPYRGAFNRRAIDLAQEKGKLLGQVSQHRCNLHSLSDQPAIGCATAQFRASARHIDFAGSNR